MTTKSIKTVTKTADAVDVSNLRQTSADIGNALREGGTAYFNGLTEIARAVGGFGREMLNETGNHLRASMSAKNVQELGELQAEWVQNRIEMSATYSKEIVDLTRVRFEDAVTPITDLLKNNKAA